jgi:hypothetical protein
MDDRERGIAMKYVDLPLEFVWMPQVVRV